MPARWIRRRRSSDRIGEELRTHIAERADHIAAGGVPRDEALRRAHAEFGAIEAYEAQCRREHRLFGLGRSLNGLGADVAHAWRRLRATPLFTIFAVVSLAAGIGVTTAMYSIVEDFFFKPAGVSNPDRVAVIVGSSVYQGGRASFGGIVSKADFDDLTAATTSFARLDAAMTFHQALAGPEHTDTVQGEAVTGAFFETVGVRAAAGRTLDPTDEDEQRAVAVLSHRYWTSRFRGNPAVVGSVVRIGGHPFEIVGVAAESFDGMSLALPRVTLVWIPLRSAVLFQTASSNDRRRPREQRRLTVVGRLAPGITGAQAGAEIATLSQRFDEAFPITARTFEGGQVPAQRRWNVRTVATAYDDFAGPAVRFGLLIMILVAMVLVVACTNLANLTLARGTARHHELSVRRALGASRWRLVREQCAESAIVAALGGVAAFIVIGALLHLFTTELPLSQAFTLQLQPKLRAPALGVAVAAATLSLAVFGLVPALQLTRRSVRADLAQGSGSVGAARKPSQHRSIRWQVAIAAGFFIVSTMAMRAVIVEARHDSGIDLDRLSVAFVNFQLQRWDDTRGRRASDAILREVQRRPELESAALSSGMPFGTTTTPFLDMAPAGTTFSAAGKYPDALALVSTPGIFRTLGVPILRGRGFDARDSAGAARVVVMNEKAARDMFGTAEVVGRDMAIRLSPLRSHNPETFVARVIGVAGDTDAQFLGRRNSGAVYIPFAQHYEPGLAIVGRARTDTRTAAEAIRAAVRTADPEVSINTGGPASVLLAGFHYAARIAALVAGLLGLLALLLSMAGLHGVLAQMVAMRTREVGLRMALGAERRQISRMVLGDGFRPVIEGLVLGLLLGVLGRFIVRATVAPAVDIFDPVALAIIPIPVLIAGFLACYVPARRAAHVDPNVALKAL